MGKRFLTKKQVIAKTARSATSLWRDVKAGTFPAPQRLGPGRVGWLESVVEEWMESRPTAIAQR